MRVALTSLFAAAVATASLTPVLAADAADAAAPAAERRAAVKMKELPSSSEAGRRLTVSGTARSGADVVVQRQYQGSGWKKVAQTEANGRGAWSTKVRLTRGGTTSFRAVVGRAMSKVDSLKVYQWLQVADLGDATYTDGRARARRVTLTDGRRYAGSYVVGSEEYLMLVVNTARRCTRASSTIGFADGVEPAADASLRLMAGDIEKPEPTVTKSSGPTRVKPVRFSVRGNRSTAFVVEHFGGESPVADAKAALASARLYCNATKLPELDPALLSRPGHSLAARGW